MEEPCTAGQAIDDDIKRHMRTACWIPKATNTQSEYVILTVFQLQQLLRENTSVLRYTYIACLVKTLLERLFYKYSLPQALPIRCNLQWKQFKFLFIAVLHYVHEFYEITLRHGKRHKSICLKILQGVSEVR